MRKLLPLIAALAALASCSPRVLTLSLEQRGPSISGIDLVGKTLSVTYLESGFGRDSVFAESLANGFAAELEDDYFGGETVIGLYRMQKDMGRSYAEKDTLVNLVMDTGGDVVFLFDVPRFGTVSMSGRRYTLPDSSVAVVSVPCDVTVYVYDSMDKRDTVRIFYGSTTASQSVVIPDTLTDSEAYSYIWDELGVAGETIGRKSAARFLSTWTRGNFSIYYFDDSTAWDEAASLAREFRWREALDIWLQLASVHGVTRRMCAEYNIAVACFILGQIELAEQWLELSDKDGPSELSEGLHKRIDKAKKS